MDVKPSLAKTGVDKDRWVVIFADINARMQEILAWAGVALG
jgi:hypothetical protein